MTYREQKSAEIVQRWQTFQAVLVFFGEIKNRRGYLSDRVLTPHEITNLESRVLHALLMIERCGANVALLEDYIYDENKIIPEIDCQLLLQFNLIEESRMYMWMGRDRIVEDKRSQAFRIGTYKHACRQLRRFDRVSRDTVKSWLPNDFKLHRH